MFYVIKVLKETRNSYFCVPQKSSVNVCLMKILKSTATKKVTVCFYSLGEEKSKEKKKNSFRNISNFNHGFV